jgi:hypothetical protein
MGCCCLLVVEAIAGDVYCNVFALTDFVSLLFLLISLVKYVCVCFITEKSVISRGRAKHVTERGQALFGVMVVAVASVAAHEDPTAR